MVRSGKANVLRQRVCSGDYTVDAGVVAEAILRLVGLRTSSMFVSPQPIKGLTLGTEQNEPGSRRDLA